MKTVEEIIDYARKKAGEERDTFEASKTRADLNADHLRLVTLAKEAAYLDILVFAQS